MPLPVLPPLHLGATTVLLLVGIAVLFLALQKAADDCLAPTERAKHQGAV